MKPHWLIQLVETRSGGTATWNGEMFTYMPGRPYQSREAVEKQLPAAREFVDARHHLRIRKITVKWEDELDVPFDPTDHSNCIVCGGDGCSASK